MAHVERRGNRRWRARYRGPDGREHSKTFDRRVDAERWLAAAQVARARGEWVNPALGRITYQQWVDQWWPTTANLRPSTRARDDTYLRCYVLPRFATSRLCDIAQLAVSGWVVDLSAQGRSAATVRKAYQLLGKSLAGAVDAGLLARSPCQRVALPRVETDEMRFLTPEEIARLADAIDHRYRAMVLVAAYGGLRLGELAGLRRKQVDLLRGTVTVTEVAVEVRGVIYTGPPKTRAGRRAVTLPRSITDTLAEHLNRLDPDVDLVFPAPEGGHLRTPAWRRRSWHPAVAAAGLEPLRPHDLRHSAVAIWIAAGANLKEVAARAGHTSVAFTLDRYGHLFDGHDEALRDRLDMMATRAASALHTTSVTPIRRQ